MYQPRWEQSIPGRAGGSENAKAQSSPTCWSFAVSCPVLPSRSIEHLREVTWAAPPPDGLPGVAPASGLDRGDCCIAAGYAFPLGSDGVVHLYHHRPCVRLRLGAHLRCTP